MAKSIIHLMNDSMASAAHDITISIVGAGGNGSFFMQELARIVHAYRILFERDLKVKCWDGDIVEEGNIGRQLFYESDIGYNKASVMISRINLSYGYDWIAIPRFVETKDDLEALFESNIVIGCVDNLKVRIKMHEYIEKNKATIAGYHEDDMRSFYYMDIGNERNSGQVILGTTNDWKYHGRKGSVPMKTIGRWIDLSNMEESNEPSCSMAESLYKQDLFVNRIAGTLAGKLLWDLLRNQYIDYHGFIFNFDVGRVEKLPI